jgi:hypothetical protein
MLIILKISWNVGKNLKALPSIFLQLSRCEIDKLISLLDLIWRDGKFIKLLPLKAQ